jgi:hypothetical protein
MQCSRDNLEDENHDLVACYKMVGKSFQISCLVIFSLSPSLV